MAAKIFYRERQKVGKSEKKPRFKLVAVSGVNLNIFADHLRKKELEQIAKEAGAKLVFLKTEASGGKDDDVEI
jgi:hypothetical protein